MIDQTKANLMAQVLQHLTAHSDCTSNKAIGQYLASDQGMWFWDEPWVGTNFNATSGLPAAALAGFNALRYLERTALYLYGPADRDRCVALFMLVLISHFRDIKTGEEVAILKGSDLTRAIYLNAQHVGFVMEKFESWAIELIYEDAEGETFSSLWWILNQTMAFIRTMGERKTNG